VLEHAALGTQLLVQFGFQVGLAHRADTSTKKVGRSPNGAAK
jgi:hypothetical protein